MNKLTILTLFLATLLITSCSLAPKKELLNLSYEIPDNYSNGKTIQLVNPDSLTQSQWWKSFNDQELNELVDKVIANNLDVKLAISRVNALESQFRIVRGTRMPQVSASAGYSLSESPQMNSNVSEIMSSGEIGMELGTVNQYSLRTGLRFELDLWGKLRSKQKSAVAELMASKSDLQTVYLGIISQAIILYYDTKAQKQQILLSNKNLGLYEVNRNIQKNRYATGIGSKVNIELTNQAYEQAKAKLEKDKLYLITKQQQLSLLSGEYPQLNNSFDSKSSPTPLLSSFPALPVSVPSKLLKSRSDIQSAEFKIESARQAIGAAKADLFPTISLTASLGSVADIFKDIFSNDKLSKTLGFEVNEGVFTGGSRLAAIDQRKILYAQQVLNYQKTVLNAFLEVENGLATIESLEKQKNAVTNLVAASKRAKDEMEKRYQKGIYPYYKLLDAEKSLFSAQSQLIAIEKAFIMSRIQLHRAFGGAWIDN